MLCRKKCLIFRDLNEDNPNNLTIYFIHSNMARFLSNPSLCVRMNFIVRYLLTAVHLFDYDNIVSLKLEHPIEQLFVLFNCGIEPLHCWKKCENRCYEISRHFPLESAEASSIPYSLFALSEAQFIKLQMHANLNLTEITRLVAFSRSTK